MRVEDEPNKRRLDCISNCFFPVGYEVIYMSWHRATMTQHSNNANGRQANIA
eukprot:m.38927 g.38927  ORF g.38927 m.38927 type:complete len:52 (-) comp10263_c0_seq1:263-418(-)